MAGIDETLERLRGIQADYSKALVIVETAQSPQVVATCDISQVEIEFQQIVQEHNAIFEAGKKLKEQFDAAFERVIKAWFAENYPGLQYHIVWGPTGDNTVIFGGTVIIDTPGCREIHNELITYITQLAGKLWD